MKKRTYLYSLSIILITCLISGTILFYPAPFWAMEGDQIANDNYITENLSPEENNKTGETEIVNNTDTSAEDIFQYKINTFLDGKPVTTRYPLFINQESRIMISADDAACIFNLVLDKTDNNQIWLTNANTSISLRAYDIYAIKNDEIIELYAAPVIINDIFFIPLRFIAEIGGYSLNYNIEKKTLYLMSANFSSSQEANIPKNLPLWGTFKEVPDLYQLYPEHKIIGGYYTTLLNNSANRTNNVKLACQKINGKVLYPNQTFSFNQTVGKRTKEAGFLEAPVFAGKKVVPGIGGGVCQVSSTLYNAVLACNLKVVERHPHSMKVAYVPDKRDATVSFGIQDFKFRNTLNRPIQILVQVIDKYVITAIAEYE